MTAKQLSWYNINILVFSCYAIWRVIICSPLTLLRCSINTAQYLLSLLSKTLPNTCSHCRLSSFLSPSHLKVLLVCLISSKVIQILTSAVSFDMWHIEFSFQNSVKVAYARHFFNFTCVLQMLI